MGELCRQTFGGHPECHAGHPLMMLSEEVQQPLLVDLAHFAQRGPDRPGDQLGVIVQQLDG